MKHYLRLVNEYHRVHKKKSRIAVICIAIAVCLVTAIFSMADMEIRAQKINAIREGGNWHLGFSDLSEEGADTLWSDYQKQIDAAGWMYSCRNDTEFVRNDMEFLLCGGDQVMCEALGLSMVKGEFPDAVNEIMIDEYALEQLALVIGNEYEFTIKDGITERFRIVGTFRNTSMLKKDDSHGIVFSGKGIETYLSTENYKKYFYIRFRLNTNLRGIIDELPAKYGFDQSMLHENTRLIALLGQSANSYMRNLYLTAGGLFILVLAAGIFMISGTFHLNMIERIQFFGMLRCLGASKRQIRHFVIKESLLYCLRALPPGILSGVLISQSACAFLRYMNPKYFGDMPIFAVSLIGIVCGILVGVLTVLLASMSPCRKASGVSPVSAVNGMNKEAAPVEMKVKTAGLPVEIALGISHAAAVKKNLLLMMGSFAISIILFLSFSIMIEFMFNAITTLKPWTPDLSVVSEDNSLSISKEVLKELNEIPEIEKSYGRMFAYDLKGSYNEEAIVADLISYEQNQFHWAKDYVIDGSLEPVETVPGQVLVEYDASAKWRVGDKIILVINGKEKELIIAGFLSSTPFHSNDGSHLMICSEETFTRLIGGGYYTIIDMKLGKNATEDTVKEIRRISGDGIKLSDRRESNTSSRAVFYSLAIFVYGFLFIIASITVFNIINSMNMSISSRIRRYGVMRAIGMSGKQIKRMVIAEAATYSVCGCMIGSVLGLLINKSLYGLAITSRWGYEWKIPVNYLLIILLIVVLSTVISVINPTKMVRNMEIVTSINCL